MTPPPSWWESFFDADYLRIWGRISTAGEDEAAALWRILDLAPGCRVLDAPCGYGRVSLPLARLGASVCGVDQSAPLLEEAERRRAEVGPDRLRYLRHDLRTPLPESGFDVALNLFSSLGYGTEAEDVAILRTVGAAVGPGGRVVIDTMHRDVLAARMAREAVPAHRFPDGTLVVEDPRFDPVTGRVENTWHWAGPSGTGRKSGSLRVYALTELVRLVESAGLRFRSALHPGSGVPFAATGPSMGGRVLLIAQRPDSAETVSPT
jgi:SAM-dependent methyltransferase